MSFIRKIKKVKTLANIPVIIFPPANHIELIAAECGASDFVRKPFDVEDLVHKVVSLVNRLPLASEAV